MSIKLKKSRIAAAAALILFLGLVLNVTDKIVRAKFIGDSTTIVNGFYAEKKNDIDLIVIGSSNSFCTINPLVLYEEYGIAAYDFGSSSQPMNISALYLKEALKKQTPKVVALEVNMMVGDSINSGNETALRWGFTDIPLSFDKLKCIYESVGAVDEEYFSYVFPIFCYHNRWKELTKTDYTYFYEDKTNYTKGYLETQEVAEYAAHLDDYEYEGEAWIAESNIKYLDEIAALCSKKQIKLVLFKSPKENWHRYETEAIRALADERGLCFVDYNELYHNGELELDPAADFRDGQHLNDFGAVKVTSHFGGYIKANCEIPDRRGGETPNSWDEACSYKSRMGQQAFMSAANAKECIELLQNDKNYVLIVTDSKSGGSKRVRQWVYEDCQVMLDVLWEDTGIRHRKIGDSELVLSKLGNMQQVLIDGTEYYQAGSRWNIIVYDKITKTVIASLNFE